MVSPFSEREREIACKVAIELSGTGRDICPPASMARRKLEEFVGNPSSERLVISSNESSETAGEDRIVLDVGRERFFSAWLQEISDHHPELLQCDTSEDATLVHGDVGRQVSDSVAIANLDDARKTVASYVANTRDGEVRPRAMLRLADRPYPASYARAVGFLRNCHCETTMTVLALLVEGRGFFSVSRDGKWITHSLIRGDICVEPAGGIHSGQGSRGDMLGICYTTAKAPPRLGIVHVATLNGQKNGMVTPIHEDATQPAYSYAIVLRDGDALQDLPSGTYFMHELTNRCFLEGEAVGRRQRFELKRNDLVSFTGKESLKVRSEGGETRIMAVCRQRLEVC